MSLRIALFGQAPFGRDVLTGLADAGHELVGVYAPPEKGRPDPMAAEAEARGLPLFRHRRFRRKGAAIPELVAEHAGLGAELNVLAYVTVILPVEIVDAPKHRSLCFHPSLLPKYRGGSAIPWQIILGERESGVTVFQPDEGVDTGPIVVQKGGVAIGPTATAASLYYDHLYALGVEAILEAVAAVDAGTATYTPQSEEGASHQGLVDDEVARIDWSRPVEELDRLARGCDPSPGAHTRLGERVVRLFDVTRSDGPAEAEPGTVLAGDDGALRVAAVGGVLRVGRMRVDDGKKGPAAESGVGPGDRLHA
jgi:methionyl-tRNA formyltransferase